MAANRGVTKVASDQDGDGILDLDPKAAEMTIADLVILDHKLRDQGSSVLELMRFVAGSAFGIKDV